LVGYFGKEGDVDEEEEDEVDEEGEPFLSKPSKTAANLRRDETRRLRAQPR